MVGATSGHERCGQSLGSCQVKLLVFGKTGQVAKALAASHNAQVTCLDRQAADLSNPEACAAHVMTTDADAIINAAAWTAVDHAETAEAAAHVINADAPGAMAHAAASRALPFIHISTDYVFSGKPGMPWRPGDPTDPINAYGRTKLAGEHAVLAAGGPSVILRTSWVFDGESKNFLTTMLRLAQTHDRLTVVADQCGGPTPAAAIAEACIAIVKRFVDGKGVPGVFHFSGAPDTTWANFSRAIFKHSGDAVDVIDVTSADYPTPATRPLNSQLDCQALMDSYAISRPDWYRELNQISMRKPK